MRKYLFPLILIFSMLFSSCNKTNLESSISDDEYIPPVWVGSTVEESIGAEFLDSEDNGVSGTPPPSQYESGMYLENDFALGIQNSALYGFEYVVNENGYSNIALSTDYVGFYTARNSDGKEVLLTPSLQLVVYPKSNDFNVLEPFIHEGTVYFRVQSPATEWIQPPPGSEWWYGIGDYAVVLSDGTYIIPFGKFDYIDKFVDGKARAQCTVENAHYIIDSKGGILRTYPMSQTIQPYRLFPNGYIYTRDVDGHSHALMDWDENILIPYSTFDTCFNPVYMGNGFFAINNDVLANGKLSGFVIYALGQTPQKLSNPDNEIVSISEGKVITKSIVNNLVGPLAVWEYTVTDYTGKILIKPGKYTFDSGWNGGYAVAKKGNKLILLDEACKEVKIPEGIELIGRYANDTALFIMSVTKDFRLWRYAEVPAKYENPIGVIDSDFNWVIPPGELENIKGLPLDNIEQFCEYKNNETYEENSLLRVYKK